MNRSKTIWLPLAFASQQASKPACTHHHREARATAFIHEALPSSFPFEERVKSFSDTKQRCGEKMESGMSGMGVYHSAERTFKARQHVSSSIHGLHSEIWAKFQGFSRHFFRGFQGLRDFHGFFLPSFRPEENGGRGGG